MMQLRPILDSDRTIGARRLVVGTDRVGRVATWTGTAWAFASDPAREILDAEAIGEIDLDE
ncbi:hypothetical protein [Croceicoccus sp. BE223]|uniref:hypothetical protein n=1 Tax=Croceicoccus sp. BE223 TaxID=2817716 RepID=UPI002857AC69|nr:hypothetical protein [Croceicoccus sp. BE223]MDR7101431.1 hypothetical protein [Croceicoccus sp. BE223]